MGQLDKQKTREKASPQRGSFCFQLVPAPQREVSDSTHSRMHAEGPPGGPGRPECSNRALLSGFVSASFSRGLLAPVQAKALQEFAVEYAAHAGAGAASCPHGAAAVGGGPPGHTPSNAQLQQLLHIQPLNLPAGLVPAPTDAGAAAAGCTTEREAATETGGASIAAADNSAGQLPVLLPAAHSHPAAALMALSSSEGGSLDAAAGLLQPCGDTALPGAPSSGSLQAHTSHHELLQALSCAADAAAVTAAATADAAAAGCPSFADMAPAGSRVLGAARKPRFTREQHAAILESVERNYAQYPGRYTELVIKEMQARFPGIELNNACVRKIKFRANEARQQQCVQQPQFPQCPEAAAACFDSQAVAGAAQCLVGLAAAAAAAGAATQADTCPAAVAVVTPGSCPLQPCCSQTLCCPPQPQTNDTAAPAAAAGENAEAASSTVATVAAAAAQTCDAAAGASGNTSPQPTVAAPAQAGSKLDTHNSDSPETLPIAAVAVGAALLGSNASVKQEQQLLPQEAPVATPAEQCTGSTGAASLQQLKLPRVAASNASAACMEQDGVDSATAAAAEAMHMLADVKQQQAAASPAQMQQIGQAPALQAAIAAAAAAAAAAAGGSSADPGAAAAAAAAASAMKRKREASVGPHMDADTAAAALLPHAEGAAAAMTPAAAAAVASSLGLRQTGSGTAAAAAAAAAADAATAAAYMQAAYDPQQQLMQHLLQQHQQQQQQVQPSWGMSYSAAVPPVDLQQQALHMQQLASGLGGSYGFLQQQQQQLSLVPGALGGGQQPAAKRQRLSGAQMAELVASVKHHVQVNPERYTHCVIKDMKEKYPDLELNMGQIRKIKFRTLGNANNTKQTPGKAADAAGADAYASSRQ